MSRVSFFVRGVPSPQGSSLAIISKSTGRPIVIAQQKAKLKVWRKTVAMVAQSEYKHADLMLGPVAVRLDFALSAPAKFVRTYPTTPPDLDKLVRSTLDALTGAVFEDDKQVVVLNATKLYTSGDLPVGVLVEVAEL